MEKPVAKNTLSSLADLTGALRAATELGYHENTSPAARPRPKRTGKSIADELCSPGSATKAVQRVMKICYLAGFNFRSALYRNSKKK